MEDVPKIPGSSHRPNHDIADVVLYHLSQILLLPPEKLDERSNFISLGGNSLSALDLFRRCRRDGVDLTIQDILQAGSTKDLLFTARDRPTTYGLHTDQLAHPDRPLSQHMYQSTGLPRQTSRLESKSSINTKPTQTIETSLCQRGIDLELQCEMTEIQISLVWGSIANPGSNLISFFDTYKADDLCIVRRAWKLMVEQEDFFHLQLRMTGGRPLVVHEPGVHPPWEEHAFTSRHQYNDALRKIHCRFPLSHSFEVLRCTDGSNDKNEGTIVWHVPHALIDGYSAKLVYSKLRAIVNGKTIIPKLVLSGPHIIAVQQHARAEGKSRKFWHDQGSQYPEATCKLPFLSQTAADSPNLETKLHTTSFKAPMAKLVTLSKQVKVSIASIYHAAWAITLSAFMDAIVVEFGAVISGREIDVVDIEYTVGNLINTLPLKILVDHDNSVKEYLLHVHHALTKLGSVSYSKSEDGFTRDFDTVLAMQFPMTPEQDDLIARPLTPPRMEIVSDVPIAICIWPDGHVRIDGHSSRISRMDLGHMSDFFSNALDLLTSHRFGISDILASLMPTDLVLDTLQKSNAFSNLTRPGSMHDDLVTRFEHTVRFHPQLIAIQKGADTMTYEELDERASRVSTSIANLVGSGDVVGVMTDRSIEWIVALYAVLKAGAVYSPIDPALPPEMRDANLRTAHAKVLISMEEPSTQCLISDPSCKLIFFHQLLKISGPRSTWVQHRRHPTPAANAYTCFTSGSSGKPKGVMCTHEGLLAFHSSPQTRLFSTPGNRIAQIMSPAFDGSIQEIFACLGWGSTLILPYGIDPFGHIQGANCAVMTPSIARVLDPDDYPLLDTVHLVGEPLTQSLSDLWSATKSVYNMYGPTEGTCGATTALMQPGIPVTIGRPNPTMRLYILDRNGNLSPPNVAGEVYLAGIQVARGYAGRASETASRFMPDPFIGQGRDMMYRTGDRALWTMKGEIRYLGRRDRLIKLRGIRLDLGDLEARVEGSVSNLTAVAIVHDQEHLLAMVQPASLDSSIVQSQMRNVLPSYAIPQLIICVDEIPTTPIGKLDYKKIASVLTVQTSDSVVSAETAQLSPTEEVIADIWRNVLDLDHSKVLRSNSDFRLLGGHSLLQLALADRLRSTFAADLPLSLCIQHLELGNLAAAIDSFLESSANLPMHRTDSHQQPSLGKYQLSPLDKEWWFKYNLERSPNTSFTVAYAALLEPDVISIDRLSAAWRTVLERHELLRSRHIKRTTNELQRVFASQPNEIVRVTDMSLHQEVNRPFDIEHESPIRIIISDRTMLVAISHIVCDYTTLRVLLQEAAASYSDRPLPPIQTTFGDSIAWSQPTDPASAEFWKETLSTMPALLFPARKSYEGRSRMYRLSPQLSQRIRNLGRDRGTSPHQIAVAAVALALTFAQRSCTDILIGAPYQNRSARDLHVVGNFVQALPTRVRYPNPTSATVGNDGDGRTFLRSVESSCQASLAHAMPTDRILECHPAGVDVRSAIPNDPLLEVMVTVHDESATECLTKASIPGVRPVAVWAEGAKFKLMFEFYLISDGSFVVRVEWDDAVVGNEEYIRLQVSLVERALAELLDGATYENIKERLAEAQRNLQVGKEEGVTDVHEFGSPMILDDTVITTSN